MTESLESVLRQLRDIEKSVKLDVFEFSVGVSHSALDEERERNSRIREKIESIIASLRQLRNPDTERHMRSANQLLKAATANTDTLRYLESISCLEGIFTDVAKAATVTALDLSREDATSTKVFSTRLLDENVKQCWEYTAQLSGLAALHLNAAADYHQFNHSINEIRGHAKQMLKLSEKCVTNFEPEGRIGEASKLYAEMEERLKVFADLSKRVQNLVLTAGKIVPISSRLLEVHKGKARELEEDEPLKVQLLMTFVGSNYTVQKGECLPLLDTTENPYLWKVKTPKGAMYIPSIACLVISSNQELIDDANGTTAEILRTWGGCLTNYRKQLAHLYYKYLKNLTNVSTTDEKAANRFLEDLERQLILTDVDDGRLARVYNKIRSTLRVHGGRKMNASDEVWNQSDISILHQPLMCLKGHMLDFRRLENFSGGHIRATNEYISNFATEARSMTMKLESLRITHDQNKAELKELCDRVQNWRTVHDESIITPRWGMGRLVLSRLASSSDTSSGVSSDEMAVVQRIPKPPSPYGRITVRPLQEPTPPSSLSSQEMDYLEPAIQISPCRHSPIQVTAPEPVQRQKVFSGGANPNPVQIETGVSVKRKKPAISSSEMRQPEPKFVRDVATQILIFRKPRQSQTEFQSNFSEGSKVASTQSERSRVDSITQIDVIKAPKEQQVTPQIIRAAIQIEGSSRTPQSGAEEAHNTLRQQTYSKNNQQVACVASAVVRLPTADLQTQVGEIFKPPLSSMQTSGPRTGFCEIGAKAASMNSANLEFRNGDQIIEGDFTTGRIQHSDAMTQAQPNIQSLNLAGLEKDISSLNLGTNVSLNSALLQTNHPSVGSATLSAQPAQAGEMQLIGSSPGPLGAEIGTQARLEWMIGVCQNQPRNLGYNTFQAACNGVDLSAQTTDETAVGTLGTVRRALSVAGQSNSSRAWDNFQICNQPILCGTNFKTDEKMTGVQSATRPMTGVKTVTYQPTINSCTCKCVPENGSVGVNQSSSTSISTTLWTGNNRSLGVTETSQNQSFSNTDIESGRICPLHVDLHLASSTPRIPKNFVRCQTRTEHTLSESQVAGYLDDVLTKLPSKSVCCQVGTMLVPREIKVATFKMGIENKESAKHLGLPEDTLLCPASVEVKPVLTEEGGIHILDLKEVNKIDIQTEYTVCTADVQKTRSEGKVISQPSEREACVIGFKTSNSKAFALGTVNVAKKTADYTATLQTLTQSECQFRIQEMKVGTCGGSLAETGIAMSRMSHRPAKKEQTTSCANDRLAADFVAHQDGRSAGTFAGNNSVSCSTQVGTMLKPEVIHMANMKMNNTNLQITDHEGSCIDRVMCPSAVQLVPTLNEKAGIQVMNIRDVGTIDMCLQNAVFKANVASVTRETQSTAGKGLVHSHTSLRQDRPGAAKARTVNEKGVGPNSPQAHILQDFNCEFNIREGQIGVLCNSCRGTGVHIGRDCTQPEPKVDAVFSSHAAVVQSAVSSTGVRTAACQVGTLLTPTTVQIAEVAMQPRNAEFANQVGLKTGAVVYPAAVQMESVLTDTAGIQVEELRDVNTLQVQSSDGVYAVSVHAKEGVSREKVLSSSQRAAPILIDVQQGKTGLTIGQTSSSSRAEPVTLKCSYALQNLGCKLTVNKMEKESVCTTCKGRGSVAITRTGQASQVASLSASRTDEVLHHATKSNVSQATVEGTNSKTVSCQVGTTLIPTVVQVADMDMTVTDPRMVKSLGLRPNAVLCPSTVELDSKLAETSGIHVMDIRDVKEVGISFGKATGKASLENRDLGIRGLAATFEPPESCYVQFKSRQAPNLVGSGLAAPHMSTASNLSMGRRIDHNAGCTFRIRDLTEISGPEHFRMVSLASTSDISRRSSHMEMKQAMPVLNESMSTATQSIGCQVGLVLVPSLVGVAGMANAGNLNIASESALQPSALELDAKIAEVSGVQVLSLGDTPNMTLQVGDKKYHADVEICESAKRDFSKFGVMQRQMTETWTRATSKLTQLSTGHVPKMETAQFSLDQQGVRVSIEIPHIARYLQNQQQSSRANAGTTRIKGPIDSETILEVTGITGAGKRVRLRIPVDLTEVLPSVDASTTVSTQKQQSTERYFSRPPYNGIPKDNIKLCDVACEALIKPNTLEKRLQTVN
nr:unnamed protein product [Spirometra erinaceieuropaei]